MKLDKSDKIILTNLEFNARIKEKTQLIIVTSEVFLNSSINFWGCKQRPAKNSSKVIPK